MSLLTIVHGGLAGRLAQRRVATPRVDATRTVEAAVEVTGGSMRFLEAGMAFIAIATAILISGR
jgi:hypothetical protein